MATSTSDTPTARLAWSWLLLAFLVPGAIAALQSAAAYATRDALGREWPYAVLQLPRWLAWAPATPLIFAAQRRWPLARPGLSGALVRHGVLSLVLSTAMEAVFLPITLAISARLNPGDVREISVAALVSLTLLGRLIPGALTYAAIVGVASTLDSRARLRHREAAAEQLRGQLAAAQLSALKMQLHPHFLFNTLQAVNVLISRDPAAASRMVTRLGDLLRTTLSRARDAEVPLGDELALVRQYLEIEHIRFADRLVVQWDVAPGLLGYFVPDLILQPLVENAITHGIATVAGPGTITISATASDDELHLTVRNTGSIPTAHGPERLGLGITRERLQTRYGSRARCTLQVDASGTTTATITLPLERHDPHA
ncbi:MAG: histidine kinase [Gemmatimonadetes bacterium]|nr:histidine kinase [Gemmatimonadota bacterium]